MFSSNRSCLVVHDEGALPLNAICTNIQCPVKLMCPYCILDSHKLHPQNIIKFKELKTICQQVVRQVEEQQIISQIDNASKQSKGSSLKLKSETDTLDEVKMIISLISEIAKGEFDQLTQEMADILVCQYQLQDRKVIYHIQELLQFISLTTQKSAPRPNQEQNVKPLLTPKQQFNSLSHMHQFERSMFQDFGSKVHKKVKTDKYKSPFQSNNNRYYDDENASGDSFDQKLQFEQYQEDCMNNSGGDQYSGGCDFGDF